jgi:hypothetical protein
MVAWPQQLRINAYMGDGPRAASGAVGNQAKRWPLRNAPPVVRSFLRPPPPANPRKWDDLAVGWGVVAVEKPGASPEELAAGTDLPEPIQQLRKDRGNAPLFRFRPGWDQRFRLLRNYEAKADVAIGQSPTGSGRECIPRYLLIYGQPEEVPWELQYVLNAHYAVGRLALSGAGLENYVAALRSGWKDTATVHTNALVWAVNHGGDDISALMRDVVAQKVFEKLRDDPDLKAGTQFLDGPANATVNKLADTLLASRPGLIVSTSHGQTYPLDNLGTLGDSLGLLVDQDYVSVTVDSLRNWEPDGAIWYAHACCSAGSAARTAFEGLTEEGSEVDRILKGVAMLGNRIAPLPTALLGAKKPLRAFIGHVEPTFDWTLQNPDTNQSLTDSMQQALYSELYQPSPVGYAFRPCYDRLGTLYTSYDQDQLAFSHGEDTRDSMLKDLLCARDVQSMVILGDPTVALPV